MARSASLEIHQINVSQGDSTLVIVRDVAALKQAAVAKDPKRSTENHVTDLPFCVANKVRLADTVKAALLIDGGNDCYGGDVVEYLEQMGAIDDRKVYQDKLSILATHFHDDHQDGTRSVLRKVNPTPKPKPKPKSKAATAAAMATATTMDVPWQTTVERYRPATFYRLADSSTRSMAWMPTIVRDITGQTGTQTTTQKIIPVGGVVPIPAVDKAGKPIPNQPATLARYEIPLGKGETGYDVVVKVLTADQALFVEGGSLTAVPDRAKIKRRTPKTKQSATENDHSIAVAIEYGSFRHFCGADIGGSTCPADADVETPLANALTNIFKTKTGANSAKLTWNGHCCSMKMSHHGSRYSNDERFVAVVRPAVVTVSSGFRLNFHSHPTADTVKRLLQAKWTITDKGKSVSMDNSIAGATAASPATAAIFATEIASKGKGKDVPDPDPNKKLNIVGAIVLRPIDETIAAVQKAAKTGTTPIEIEVYGDLSQTPITSAETGYYALKPVAATPKTAPYPIGPFSYTCNTH